MNAFAFGRHVGAALLGRTKIAKSFWGWNDKGGARTWYQELLDPSLTSSQWGTGAGLTGGASPFIDAVDRWYNPWSNSERSREKGEEYLRVPGQIAMGTGAAAGTLAGGLAVAAPSLAATPVSAVPGALMTGGGGTAAAGTAAAGGAAASNPTVQQMFPTFAAAGQQLAARAQPVVQAVQNNVIPRVQSAHDTMKRINYSPTTAAKDLYAASTGNFDQIEGPGWGGALSPLNGVSIGIPGAPSAAAPTPFDATRQVYDAANTAVAGMFGGGAAPQPQAPPPMAQAKKGLPPQMPSRQIAQTKPPTPPQPPAPPQPAAPKLSPAAPKPATPPPSSLARK